MTTRIYNIQETFSRTFIETSLMFAARFPNLTLMYNAVNAGKTIPNQYWLLSLYQYKALVAASVQNRKISTVDGITLHEMYSPSYGFWFDFGNTISLSANILYNLACYLEQMNFNIFLFNRRAHFIPREPIEVPYGFGDHRFGGLEMIGYFVMKSLSSLITADPRKLLEGIRQVSYQPAHQSLLETYLLNGLR